MFRVGDRVRRINYSNKDFGVKVGEVYTVSAVRKGEGGDLALKEVDTCRSTAPYPFAAGLFELVSETLAPVHFRDIEDAWRKFEALCESSGFSVSLERHHYCGPMTVCDPDNPVNLCFRSKG